MLVALRSALLSAASACFVTRVRALSFEPKRSARHAVLSRSAVDADAASGEVAKISHGGTSGAWNMSIASDGFAPMTGHHVWRVKVNRCVKNHVFVGVATAKARPEGYLGSNADSWGVIGTREVWHAARKLRSDYGDVFRQGAHLELDYDSDRGTLSIERVCGGLTLREAESGVVRSSAPAEFAFVKMPRHETLYPAGAFPDTKQTTKQNKQTSALCRPRLRTDTSRSFPSPPPHSHSHAVALLNNADCVSVYFPRAPLPLGGVERAAAPHARAKLACAATFASALVDQYAASWAEAKAAATRFDAAQRVASAVLKPALAEMCLLWSTLNDVSFDGGGAKGSESRSLAAPLRRLVDVLACDDAEVEPRAVGRGPALVGAWVVHSGAAGPISAQKYTVSFHEAATGALTGSGGASKTRCEVAGRVRGTRVRYVESWNSSKGATGDCFIVARLAVDGRSFAGVYQDNSTGAVGTLFAHVKAPATAAAAAASPSTSGVRLSTLATMLLGKAAAQRVVASRLPQPASASLALWCCSALFARGVSPELAAAVDVGATSAHATPPKKVSGDAQTKEMKNANKRNEARQLCRGDEGGALSRLDVLDAFMRTHHAKPSRFTASITGRLAAARVVALRVLLDVAGATGAAAQGVAALLAAESAAPAPLLPPDARLVAVWKTAEKLMRKMRVLVSRVAAEQSAGAAPAAPRSADDLAAELEQRARLLSSLERDEQDGAAAAVSAAAALPDALRFLSSDLSAAFVDSLALRLRSAARAAASQAEALETLGATLATLAPTAAAVAPAFGSGDGVESSVSVLLCTVTFHANRAHNLTRSP